MPSGSKYLARLAEEVGRFHLRDGAMLRAQRRMTHLLETGNEIPSAEVETYIKAVQRYFSAFEREARTHLADLDRRLSHVGQLQFNLIAERGVAARRIEATQGVLSVIEELKRP